MLITVAICTFNRAESLRRTLASLAIMHIPADLDWELVIVNNNCTDHTDDVIRAFQDRLPVRREFEPESGHSRARNHAVETAKGDYIVWTDDDVLVDRGWLAAYVEAFRRQPEAAIFGGPIIPKFEPPVVGWVAESEGLLGGPFAIRDFGGDALPLSVAEDRLPFGANFALRAVEQRAVRYNPDLGLAPNRRRLGDESDLIERLMRAGATGYWVPGARVEHCIGQERQTIRYIARYFIGWGETSAYRDSATFSTAKFWFGAPRWLWRRSVGAWLRYRIHRLMSPAPVWVKHLADYASARGAIRYWRGEKLRAP